MNHILILSDMVYHLYSSVDTYVYTCTTSSKVDAFAELQENNSQCAKSKEPLTEFSSCGAFTRATKVDDSWHTETMSFF